MTTGTQNMPAGTTLADLAKATWDFATATLILSTLTAVLVQALYDFSLRYYLQSYRIKMWIGGRLTNSTQTLERLSGTKKGSLYSLPYRRLCGQIGNALRNELDYFDYSSKDSKDSKDNQDSKDNLLAIFANNAKDELEKIKSLSKTPPEELTKEKAKELAIARELVAYQAERGLDELQITLGKFLRRAEYVISIFISMVLMAILILTPNSFQPEGWGGFILYLSVFLTSGFLAPTFRNLLEKLVYLR